MTGVDLFRGMQAAGVPIIEDDCILIEDCYCECISDTDEDDICDENDNCPDDYNPNQEDSNNDGIGDACEQTSLNENINNRKLIKVVDVLGREVNELKKYTFLFHVYDNGEIIPHYIIK